MLNNLKKIDIRSLLIGCTQMTLIDAARNNTHRRTATPPVSRRRSAHSVEAFDTATNAVCMRSIIDCN